MHERMMAEAEPIVKYNWLDVALHDKRKLDKASTGCVFAWILSELGSTMIPMYCMADEKQIIEGTGHKYLTSRINTFIISIDKNEVFGLENYSFYLVVKGDTPDAGDIIPVDLVSFVEFTAHGRWTWVKGDGVIYK